MTAAALPDDGPLPDEVDVVVVGAGPSGSATAHHLARRGRRVLLLEKTGFPREKVCGDGLTPRAVAALADLGVDTAATDGWARNAGLRVVSGGRAVEVPWPEHSRFPSYGLTRTRADLDGLLADRAAAAGADLRVRTPVVGPLRDERTGRVAGVLAEPRDPDGRPLGPPRPVRARVVVAADGAASRLSGAVGRPRRPDRPIGVAVRTYHGGPGDDDPWLETWLEVPDGDRLLPGYAWVFGLGDGTRNVGIGLLDASAAGAADARGLLRGWTASLPADRELDEGTRTAPVRGAALAMGLNRTPHYARGLLLVGDAGGLVNPFNGEGISYALESGALAADAVDDALTRPRAEGREAALHRYPRRLAEEYGGYYAAGRAFLRLIGDPRVMRAATTHGPRHPRALAFTVRVLANLTDAGRHGGPDRAVDAVVAALGRARRVT
ncbi:MAG: geranylgeranyl reductase family protein [Candidatus Nanopelagicales bacterium]